MPQKLFAGILGLGLVWSTAFSASAAAYDNVLPRMGYLETERDAYSIESIQSEETLAAFQSLQDERFAIGYTGGKDHWFTIDFDLANTTGWHVLEFYNPRLGEAILYQPDEQGNYYATELGARHPFWNRQIGGLTPAFPIQIETDEPARYYVRVRHFGSLRFEARLWELNDFNRGANRALAFYLILSGALLTLAIFNLSVAAQLRQVSYFWLGLFLAALNFDLMCTSGTANMLLWPSPSWLKFNSMPITDALTIWTGIAYCNEFLKAAPGARILTRLNLFAGFLALLGLLGGIFQLSNAFYLMFLGGLIAPLAVTIMAVRASWAQQPYAKSFLACWGLLLMSAVMTCLLGPGFLPATPFTENFIFMAAFPAAVGWSFTLTSQVRRKIQNERQQLEQEVAINSSRLKDALEEVETLHGLLPICCNCKKIRDDSGYWQHVETYFHAHLDTNFSHGICPDCATNLYPEYFPDSDNPDPTSPRN